MTTWCCVKGCGACCYLEPSERPDLEEYLTPEEFKEYLSMVGEGGWCINFDRTSRECRIYSNRPRFCRVESETFHDMFGIAAEELNDFAIECCQEHISDIYGADSPEMQHFNQKIEF